MEIGVRFIVVFQTDGLDKKGMKKSFEDDGITVEQIDEDILTMGDTKYPVTTYLLRGSLGDFLKTKIKYNCQSAEDNMYVLFPIERGA